jgi:hypothetical protein
MACVVSIGIIVLSLFNYFSLKAKAEADAAALFSANIAKVAAQADGWIQDLEHTGGSALIGMGDVSTIESAQAALPILQEYVQSYKYDDVIICLDDKQTRVSARQIHLPATNIGSSRGLSKPSALARPISLSLLLAQSPTPCNLALACHSLMLEANSLAY